MTGSVQICTPRDFIGQVEDQDQDRDRDRDRDRNQHQDQDQDQDRAVAETKAGYLKLGFNAKCEACGGPGRYAQMLIVVMLFKLF